MNPHNAKELIRLTDEDLVRLTAGILEEEKAREIVALDMREVTLVADYFVICTGNSKVHVQAIADRVLERFKEEGCHRPSVEGYEGATWVVLDCGAVVVHVFQEDLRVYYGLERLWGDAKQVSGGDVR